MSVRPGPLASDVRFLGGSIAALVSMLSLLRGILLYANFGLAKSIPVSDLVTSFLIGLRFDLLVACLPTLVLIPALLFPHGLGKRKFVRCWLSGVGCLTLLAGVAEIEFYREFHVRLNNIAFHYLQDDPATVSSMLWNGYPVARYLLLWLLLTTCYVAGLNWLNRITSTHDGPRARLAVRIPVMILVLFLVAWGGRGTLRSGPPLRWGDAFQSEYMLANHLGLNGTYTLVKAAIAETRDDSDRDWLTALPDARALDTVRTMLMTPADTLLAGGPILRRHTPPTSLPQPPKNVVVVIMESFSGEFVGALGRKSDITPEFDKLAQQGLLFDHFFSNGTHTHQGMFASLACFPNLPGHEYLMQQAEGQHRFSGLPALLSPRGYKDVYVYNGHFAWDNQQGFFRNQGMSRFIGRDDYFNPVFMDPTWGVSDEDMFERAVEELDELGDSPFYAVLQTLSNHTPYALPEQLPVEPVQGYGHLDEHLTALRYSDWALGQFFEQARKRPWFPETLFVVLGDHGFSLEQQLTEIDLLRFHVPMLIIGPEVQTTYGRRNHTVGSQTDLVPTLVGLLGKPFVHQCWGRNLLALPDGDPGMALIKPSGSDPSVALLEGDHIVLRNGAGDIRNGLYYLYPEPRYIASDDSGSDDSGATRLTSYVQVAVRALLDNHTGVPDV